MAANGYRTRYGGDSGIDGHEFHPGYDEKLAMILNKDP